MIALDDLAWRPYRHAYGSVSDVSALLQALALSPSPAASYDEEPWFSLWSSLCHQGDVYEASCLAVPHIVRIAAEAGGLIDPSFLHLPAAVEVARATGHGPAVPTAHADAYHGAVARLPDIVSLHARDVWNRTWLLSAVAAQAVAKGHVDVAEALLELDQDWIARILSDERG